MKEKASEGQKKELDISEVPLKIEVKANKEVEAALLMYLQKVGELRAAMADQVAQADAEARKVLLDRLLPDIVGSHGLREV